MHKLKFYLRQKYYFFKKLILDFSFFLFTKTKASKTIDFYQIPIIIISFNQLYYLKKLVTFLVNAGYQNIVILDNNSSYQPLIDYLNEIKNKITLHQLKENYGHKVFWSQQDIQQLYGKSYFVLTDPDIVPVDDCPKEFLNFFKKVLDKNIFVSKVGFSLFLNDIPDENPDKENILNWEKKFSQIKDKNGNFKADIDTTFALYKPMKFWQLRHFHKAIRTKEPYCARHGGWYINPSKLSIEQEFYKKTANSSSSWLSNDSILRDKYFGTT